MVNNFDIVYGEMLTDILTKGTDVPSRTGISTRKMFARHLMFDLAQGFPVMTWRKINWRAAMAETLGFIRGYDNAAQFRSIGCNVWDGNANDPGLPHAPNAWLANPNRKGTDDLGRIYGVQWRAWWTPEGKIDQLAKLIQTIKTNPQDRRMIVTAWNPGELGEMALPPCHRSFQVSCVGNVMDMLVDIRSWDTVLGAPFNIVGYAFMLHVLCGVTGKIPGKLNFFAGDYHIYHNHFDGLEEMFSNVTKRMPPKFHIAWPTNDLNERFVWLENDANPKTDFVMKGYEHGPAIKFEMAV